MRVALDQHGEVGVRAAHILLAERDLSIGLLGRKPKGDDPRIHRARDLEGYDLVVSDDVAEPARAVGMALASGVGCVLYDDGGTLADERGEDFAESETALLVGANLAAGIAPALASHETARGGEILDVILAWTEPGSPIRRGEPIPFPDPVGARWARRRQTDDSGYAAYVAPISGQWAGALARVTSATPTGVVTRIVGVADLAPHLEAVALAAAVMAFDVYSPGAHRPPWAAEIYLAAALRAGLDVAVYSLASD